MASSITSVRLAFSFSRFSASGSRSGNRHAGHFGDAFDGLAESSARHFGQEAEVIARHTAAEAMVVIFGGGGRPFLSSQWKAKGVCFTPWKGAARPIVPARRVGLCADPTSPAWPISEEIGTRSRISSRKELEKRIVRPCSGVHISTCADGREAGFKMLPRFTA